MEKEKIYINTKFAPTVFRAARNSLDVLAPNVKSYNEYRNLSVEISENEKWKFDTEEEFFAAYRGNKLYAYYDYQKGSYSLRISLRINESTVTISAPTRNEIETISQFFEDEAPNSSIPSSESSFHYSTLPKFKIKRNLPSCKVDKKLVGHLENFFIKELPKLTNVTSEKIKGSYKISILDISGKEQLSSSNEYTAERFSDTTSSIALSCDVRSNKLYLNLSIDFDREKRSSVINIDCQSDKPRELVNGIAEGLIRIIDTNKTNNHIYHPHPAIESLCFVAPFALLPLAIYLFFSSKNYIIYGWLTILIIMLILIYSTVAKKWNAYTTFDSQLQTRFSATWNWLFYGVLSFIIFSTGLAFWRKEVFGF